jgi:DNA-binding HxlR family transcriptional regulator
MAPNSSCCDGMRGAASRTHNHGGWVTESETPRTPGWLVRGSGRPIVAALDLFGRRWAMRILWELRDGPLAARALRERCDGMLSGVLDHRLSELIEAGLVTQLDDLRYDLTDVGQALRGTFESLDEWSRRWAEVE